MTSKIFDPETSALDLSAILPFDDSSTLSGDGERKKAEVSVFMCQSLPVGFVICR
jgi:hypothetical protein